MGDLAAGTMVIKEKNYRKIHVSLDEFDYLTQNYQPTYPQAADLSLEQINVITRTLQSGFCPPDYGKFLCRHDVGQYCEWRTHGGVQ